MRSRQSSDGWGKRTETRAKASASEEDVAVCRSVETRGAKSSVTRLRQCADLDKKTICSLCTWILSSRSGSLAVARNSAMIPMCARVCLELCSKHESQCEIVRHVTCDMLTFTVTL